ncbi:hypothetical protein [Phenylobacterium sp. NIBR 498073]|uniref:hypothetical protein n=1 Tax=Phenylobacterium sp. NIBR 498073 TaxID=3015177 RepID=UPI0022B53FC8|nr:hypothetical protein [Phenylobacterium sp. NIBR 498073]MBS0490852.1 hypothetical protein [Pseudomonadota bacterium]WGU39516.1 hypothetical protein O4N75_17970 [Phenylobacterium sp. NIBR 498073]
MASLLAASEAPAPPKAISTLSFDLPVGRPDNVRFREALIDFSYKYRPGGYPVSHVGELGASRYEIVIPTDCSKSDLVLGDIVRGAAPVDRVPEFLAAARGSARCQAGAPPPPANWPST